MLNKETITKQFEGIAEDQALAILANDYGINWVIDRPHCKLWFAQVFNYNRESELQEELNLFLWFINFIVVPITGAAFNQEDTVFQGCTCPCSRKQTILYYTLSRNL